MNIGACGIVCMICRHYVRGLCQGCVRGDQCPPERAVLSPCPVLRCAAARKIPYCIRDCAGFPCDHFERRFPRCWSQVTSQHSGVTLLDGWESIGPPLPVTTSDIERSSDWEGLRVFCLGPFRVYRGSEEVRDSDWGQCKGPTYKIKALFAYLLSQKKRGARKETLIDLLWPKQTDSQRASVSFHLALHNLRRALEPDLKSRAASSYIQYERGRYRFDPLKSYWIDADVFEAYCYRAQECNRYGDSEMAILYRGMASDLYGGDYMAGIHPDYTQNSLYDWCIPRRYRLRELHLTMLLEMARYYHDIGEYGLGVKYAREALDVEPAFESAHHIAMQCLIEDGRPNDAIHQYRMCEVELAWCEDRTPSEQIRLLHEQLIGSPKYQ